MKDIDKKLAFYKTAGKAEDKKEKETYSEARLLRDIYKDNKAKKESLEREEKKKEQAKVQDANSGFKAGFAYNVQRFSTKDEKPSKIANSDVEITISSAAQQQSPSNEAKKETKGQVKKEETKTQSAKTKTPKKDILEKTKSLSDTIKKSASAKPAKEEKKSSNTYKLTPNFTKPVFKKLVVDEKEQTKRVEKSEGLLSSTQESKFYSKDLEPKFKHDDILKDVGLDGENAPMYKAAESGDGYRKIAKFLMLLGKNESANILRQFKDDEIEVIALHMSKIKKIEPVEAEALLKEFSFLKDRAQNPSGGINVASNILINALGKEKAEGFIKKIEIKQQRAFEFLNDIEASQLYILLKNESSQVLAIILSFLDKKLVSEFLKMLPSDKSVEIIKHLAVVKEPSTEVLMSIENSLKEKLRKLSSNTDTGEDFEGSSALAGILRYMDIGEEEEILDVLKKENPELAAEVKEKLITIDLILGVDSVEFQEFLKEFSNTELATLVKGQSREIIDKIYNNVSQQRRSDIESEREALGAMHRRDVNLVVKDFLNKLKIAQGEGRLYIYPGERI